MMTLQMGRSGSVTFKALTIGAIVLCLMIPLSMLRGLVSERAGLREHAHARVAEGWGGGITLGGPIVIVPTERTVRNGEKHHMVRSELFLLPAQMRASLNIKLEEQPRRVGIYEVPVYLADARLSGEFDFAGLAPLLNEPDTTYHWQQARVLLPLSQVRSLREVSRARFADAALKFTPATQAFLAGIEARVDLRAYVNGGLASFEFDTVVAGSRDIFVLPVGSETQVQVRSNWPHPSFQGAFLPSARNITSAGFDAKWQVLELNRAYAQAWKADEVSQAQIDSSALGVGLYQTVDIYQRGERAIKYALLFIALTFLTFFAWEQLTGTRLHPLQYLLVGLALSTFYLLLIALSEHVAFAAAYSTAAVALVLLIGAYVAGALHSRRRGILVGAAMTFVYGILYALVLSEDYALLLGAITLFVTLAAVMLVTRKLDWYALGSTPE
jgi:inner membrane protein